MVGRADFERMSGIERREEREERETAIKRDLITEGWLRSLRSFEGVAISAGSSFEVVLDVEGEGSRIRAEGTR